MSNTEKKEVVGDLLFANGKVYIDMLEYVKLQKEYSRLLADSMKSHKCKMVAMKGGAA